MPRLRIAAAFAAFATLAAVSLASVPAGALAGHTSRAGSKTIVHVSPTDPIIAAAGNIACDPNNPAFNGGAGTASACRMRYVSNLLLKKGGVPRYRLVLGLGDMQYVCGGLAAYRQSYGPTWGRVLSVTRPVVGDKDYRSTANAPGGTDCTDPPGHAAGFFGYFGPTKPYLLTNAGSVAGSGAFYSFNFPRGCTPGPGKRCWHLIALNGNCRKAPGCVPGTDQYDWLQSDLTAHPNLRYRCTIAFWHWPRFTSGKHGNDPTYDPIWRLLYARGVDIVLNAHDHDYERFAPQNPNGVADLAKGIREFVVGTGGESHVRFPTAARLPTSRASNALTFGILTLTLHTNGYDWRFIHAAGGTFTDASIAPTPCH